MAEYLVSDPAIQDSHPHTQYDLIANICHEGEPGKGKLMHFFLTDFVLTLVCKVIIQVLLLVVTNIHYLENILDDFTFRPNMSENKTVRNF